MDALQKAQRIAQAIVRQHDTDSSMYTVAFEKEMLQDATLLVAVAQAEALARIADALEQMLDALALREKDIYVQAYEDAEADAVRADTDSLRAEDWPEPVANGDAPTFEHGIEVGRKRLINDIQNGEWPPELYDVPHVPAAPGRWEPVRGSRRIRCHGGEDELGEYTTELTVQGDNLQMEAWLTHPDYPGSQLVRLSAELPTEFAICRRVEVSDA